jgi:hypothetical protein
MSEADEDRSGSLGSNRNIAETADLRDYRAHRNHRDNFAEAYVSGRADRIAFGKRLHDLVRAHAIGTQPIRVGMNDDCPGAAAEGRRCRHPLEGREQRPHLEERGILQVLQAELSGLVGEHQVPDRHAAGIEPHHERRHGTCGHKRAGAVDIRHRLRHRAGHVGARVELQLDQCRALDRLGFDMLDAGDVEKMILVIVDEKPFHLGRVHAAIWLGDVKYRHAKVGENVARHPLDGEEAGKDGGENEHHNGDRPAQGKRYQVHPTQSDQSSGVACYRVTISHPSRMHGAVMRATQKRRGLSLRPARSGRQNCQAVKQERPGKKSEAL